MANAQYNEVTNDVQPWTNLDPMYSRSTVLRVKPSRLQCPTQTQHRRGRMLSRCLTQPITFIEIQEAEDEESCGMSGAAPRHGASKEVIWSRFEFSRQVDSRLTRNDSAGDTDSEHSTTTVGSSHPLPNSPDTTSGSHLLQEYERRRRRSQRQKRTTSIEELPETEKGD